MKCNISFNRRFYTREAIAEALADFHEVCSGKITYEDDESIQVEILADDEINIPLEDEFCNYALGLVRNKDVM